MRVALLTPEFVSESGSGGGLGNYLYRLCVALKDAGHVPEVFLLSREGEGTVHFMGIVVHRVRPDSLLRAEAFLARRVGTTRLAWMVGGLTTILGALCLAAALRRRQREAPFDLVQSPNYRAAGLFVGRRRGRPHLVRISSAPDLLAFAEGRPSAQTRFQVWLEFAAMRRGDAVYAPSRYVARHLSGTLGAQVSVVRPPVFIDCEPAARPANELPPRYFVHFGQLMARKGTSWTIAAARRAFEAAPDMRLVCIGPSYGTDLADWRTALGPFVDNVLWLGPTEKPELYAIVRRSVAAVLPSLVDNLPNTVIESLLLGVPVIGTAGASIDELVEHGRTGLLVPINDVEALARALLDFWRAGRSVLSLSSTGPGFALPPEFEPAASIDGLLALARRVDRGRKGS